MLDQLEDPASDLSQRWEEEHTAHLVGRLCERAQKRFTPYYWEAFRKTALEGRPAVEVAGELGASVNAVLLARSRVLAFLRQEGEGMVE